MIRRLLSDMAYGFLVVMTLVMIAGLLVVFTAFIALLVAIGVAVV
jgi:hypothetical protein